jgi:ATP-binding cassette, subfamily B, bacterial PglK
MKLSMRRKLDMIEKLNGLFDRKERMHFAGVAAAVLAAAFFQALGVVSILPFIELVMDPAAAFENRVLNFAFTFFGFADVLSFTMAVGFAVLGVLVIGNLVSAFAEWMKIRFVWQKSHRMSVTLLKHYLFLPYTYFLNAHSADLSKNIVFEVQQFTTRLLLPFLQIITKGILVSVIIVLLLLVHPVVALGAVLVFGISYFVVFFFLRGALRQKGERRLHENTGRFTAAAEAFAGIKDIKALGREDYFLRRFSRHSNSFSGLQAWTGVAIQLPRYFMEVVAFGGVIVLILVFLSLKQGGAEVIPLISFFAFAGYRLMPAVQSIFQAASDIQFHRAVLDRFSEDMRVNTQTHSLVLDRVLPTPLGFKESIQFTEISFVYPYAKEPAIRNIDMRISKGASVGLVGPTGGGKTTFVDIFIGLLSVSSGTFQVDGVSVEERNIRNWQRNIGYVPQQIFLADDTIAKNIAFGLPDEKINMDQIVSACKMANVHDFIARELPEGYHTLIGERGVRLSGGQRQRIGIARALYHDPAILVLDEATSSLDGITEKAVLEAIGSVAKFKTLVIVAHRLTAVKKCDIIYIIERGAIVAQGTYDVLMKTNSSFQAMAQQSKSS